MRSVGLHIDDDDKQMLILNTTKENLKDRIHELMVKFKDEYPESQFVASYRNDAKCISESVFDEQFGSNSTNSTNSTNSYDYASSSSSPSTKRRRNELVPGQRIIFLRNHYGGPVEGCPWFTDDVRNGEIDILKKIVDYNTKTNKIQSEDVESTRNPIPSNCRRWLFTEGGRKVDLSTIRQRYVADGSCITGYKSQGNEYTNIFIYLRHNDFDSKFQNRNYAYTMVTRGKKRVVILCKRFQADVYDKGRFGTFYQVCNTDRPIINTYLCHLLPEINIRTK